MQEEINKRVKFAPDWHLLTGRPAGTYPSLTICKHVVVFVKHVQHVIVSKVGGKKFRKLDKRLRILYHLLLLPLMCEEKNEDMYSSRPEEQIH